MLLQRVGRKAALPHWLAVGLLGALLSGFAAALVHRDERLDVDERFQHSAQRLQAAVLEALADREEVLLGAAGLLAAMPETRQTHWQDYVASLSLEAHFPGLSALAWGEWLPRSALAAHVERQRDSGFPSYAVFPEGARDHYVPVTLVAPLSGDNQRVPGFDMYSDPQRRLALDRARDSGSAAISGRVTLATAVLDPAPAAVVMVLPVYAAAQPLSNAQERRAALRGFVVAPIEIDDLLLGLADSRPRGVFMRIVDGDGAVLSEAEIDPEQRPSYPLSLHKTMQVYGRTWQLEFLPTLELSRGDLAVTPLVLASGLTISLLLAGLLGAMGGAEARARAMAAEMTHAVRDAEAAQRAILDSSAEGILTIDPRGIVKTFNHAAEYMFGFSVDEVLGRNVSMLMPERYRARHDALVANFDRATQRRVLGLRREVVGLRRDGAEFPMSLAINVIDGTGPRRLVGVISDISERKRIERELANANSLRESILDGAAFGIIATDIDGTIRALNPAAERLLWFSRDELVGKALLTRLYDPGELAQRAQVLSRELSARIAAGFETVSAKASRGLTDESEWTFVRRDGSRVPVQTAVTALRDASGVINGYLGIVYDITERRRQEEYIRHIAEHDALTQLPNRMLLQDRLNTALSRARRDRRQVGVLMVDLDHFKRINDSLGHHVGDEVLLTAAARLSASIRECDSVARMGGDEFVILLADMRDRAAAQRIAAGLVEAFMPPIQVGSHELHVSASIGIACYPGDGTDVSTLLKNADTAMYHAKASGRAGYRMFSAEMLRKANEKLELEGALRHALARGEFEMHYEPQIDLASGHVTGVEALIRWRHPQRGMVSPADFIPVAEETGLIVPIGEWTLRTVCTEIRQMQQRQSRPLTVAVNLSPRQFAQPNLVKLVQDTCSEAALDPAHLVLEITEGTLMASSDETIGVLRRLRALGVGIAVDDFGTGYSSLSYLTRFPIDRIKIDRSFVRDLIDDEADAAVARAIIAMAHGIGVHVIAEGVETADQLALLRSYHCDAAQGYHIGLGQTAASFAICDHDPALADAVAERVLPWPLSGHG